jgi:hypothetical protein
MSSLVVTPLWVLFSAGRPRADFGEPYRREGETMR